MKQILFFTLMVLASLSMQAQHKKSSNAVFDCTLRGGVNLCQIDGDGAGHYNKIGFNAGVNTTFPLSQDDEGLRMLVEIGLTQKGSHISRESIDKRIALTYVEIPLMLTYTMMEWRIGAGFAPAILAKSNVTQWGEYDYVSSNNYRRMDPLPFCCEVQYMGENHWGASLRFYDSMFNMSKSSTGTYRCLFGNPNTIWSTGQFNRLITGSVCYRF